MQPLTIPPELLRNAQMPKPHRDVLAAVAQSGTLALSCAAIARWLGWSERAVYKAVGELSARGYLVESAGGLSPAEGALGRPWEAQEPPHVKRAANPKEKPADTPKDFLEAREKHAKKRADIPEKRLELGRRFAALRAKANNLTRVTPDAARYYAEYVVKPLLSTGERTEEHVELVLQWFEQTKEGFESFNFGGANTPKDYQHAVVKNFGTSYKRATDWKRGGRQRTNYPSCFDEQGDLTTGVVEVPF